MIIEVPKSSCLTLPFTQHKKILERTIPDVLKLSIARKIENNLFSKVYNLFLLNFNLNIWHPVWFFLFKARLIRHYQCIGSILRLILLKTGFKVVLFYFMAVDWRRRIMLPETGWALSTIMGLRTRAVITLTNWL